MLRAAFPVLATAVGLLTAVATLAPNRVAHAADGPCHRWTLEVTCVTSKPRAALNEEFTATVVAKNTGDTELLDVTVRLRGDRGAPCVSGPAAGVSVLVPRLAPGESKELSARFTPEQPGIARVLGGARDASGHVFGTCASTVVVSEKGESPDDGQSQHWNLQVTCAASSPFTVVSGTLSATVTAKNVGDTDLMKVTIKLLGDDSLRCVSGPAEGVSLLVERLAPGESKEISAKFSSEAIGPALLSGSAKDSYAQAFARCECAIDVRGLVAIQADMTDKAIDGSEKGVFRKGEEFFYKLTVANDGGTGTTPDLKVVLTLPKELQFVSGASDGGVTMKGEGQTAESSLFRLAPPAQTLRFDLRVRVLSVPPSQLVKALASIQTTDGIELGSETESTTVK